MKGGFVTDSVGTIGRGETRRPGRPRKHASNAQRVAAHRAARLPKEIAVGCRVGTRFGTGIVQTATPTLLFVAFRANDGRIWRDLSPSEVTVISKPKALPKWVTGYQRDRRIRVNRLVQMSSYMDNSVLHASVGRESQDSVPTYRRGTKGGKSVVRKDYTKAINNKLVELIEYARRAK